MLVIAVQVDVNLIIGEGSSLRAPVLRNVGAKGLSRISEEVSCYHVRWALFLTVSCVVSCSNGLGVLGCCGLYRCAVHMRMRQSRQHSNLEPSPFTILVWVFCVCK